MKVEIVVYTKSDSSLTYSFGDECREGMKVVKAVSYPGGKLHSIYRLEFATGEWVTKCADGTWPPNTIYGQELFDRLESKEDDEGESVMTPD